MDQLIKQLRKEVIPVLDQIIATLQNKEPKRLSSTSKGGLALLKYFRIEILDRIKLINDLVNAQALKSTKAAAVPSVKKTPAPKAVATSAKPVDANPKS